jgi:hypothetical protein
VNEDTKKRVEEIETRASAATEGPWSDVRVGREGDGNSRSHEEQICNQAGVGVLIVTHDGSDEGRANGNFIAHARQDVPFLLDLVKKQAEEIAAWREFASARFAYNNRRPGARARNRSPPRTARHGRSSARTSRRRHEREKHLLIVYSAIDSAISSSRRWIASAALRITSSISE